MSCRGVGAVIKNRYTVVEVLGRGSMACVYLVDDGELDTRWALKEMDLEGVDPDGQLETVELFLRESAILSRLAHPAFPLVVDAFHERDCAYLVMELVEGRTLEEIVAQNGPTPESYLLPLAQELAAALDVLHGHPDTPIIFRDLKPSNVMVADNGTVKLVDFGIARFYKPGQSSDTHPLGTPGFAPPEQWGSSQTTPRSDLYALGATLYYALTGTDVGLPGQEHPPLRQRAPQCSEKMEALLERCLQVDPRQRPASAAEVLRDLEAIPTVTPTLGAPRRRRESLWQRWVTRNYRLRTPKTDNNLGCGCLLVIAILFLVPAFGPRFRIARSADFGVCKDNLKTLGTALDLYASKNRGHYPSSLHQLTVDSCASSCPAAVEYGYNQGYATCASPPAYTLVCRGTNHRKMLQGEHFPQYTSRAGLVTQ